MELYALTRRRGRASLQVVTLDLGRTKKCIYRSCDGIGQALYYMHARYCPASEDINRVFIIK